jgi:hypothetical protein
MNTYDILTYMRTIDKDENSISFRFTSGAVLTQNHYSNSSSRLRLGSIPRSSTPEEERPNQPYFFRCAFGDMFQPPTFANDRSSSSLSSPFFLRAILSRNHSSCGGWGGAGWGGMGGSGWSKALGWSGVPTGSDWIRRGLRMRHHLSHMLLYPAPELA